jgi:hypothetical protein
MNFAFTEKILIEILIKLHSSKKKPISVDSN